LFIAQAWWLNGQDEEPSEKILQARIRPDWRRRTIVVANRADSISAMSVTAPALRVKIPGGSEDSLPAVRIPTDRQRARGRQNAWVLSAIEVN